MTGILDRMTEIFNRMTEFYDRTCPVKNSGHKSCRIVLSFCPYSVTGFCDRTRPVINSGHEDLKYGHKYRSSGQECRTHNGGGDHFGVTRSFGQVFRALPPIQPFYTYRYLQMIMATHKKQTARRCLLEMYVFVLRFVSPLLSHRANEEGNPERFRPNEHGMPNFLPHFGCRVGAFLFSSIRVVGPWSASY